MSDEKTEQAQDAINTNSADSAGRSSGKSEESSEARDAKKDERDTEESESAQDADGDKTDAEKIQKIIKDRNRANREAVEAKRKLHDLEAKYHETSMKLMLRDAGINKEMLDYAMFELGKDKPQDIDKWIGELKQKAPFVFIKPGQPPATGAAGPPVTTVSEKQAKVDALTKEIEALKSKQTLTNEQRARLISLVGERKRLA